MVSKREKERERERERPNLHKDHIKFICKNLKIKKIKTTKKKEVKGMMLMMFG